MDFRHLFCILFLIFASFCKANDINSDDDADDSIMSGLILKDTANATSSYENEEPSKVCEYIVTQDKTWFSFARALLTMDIPNRGGKCYVHSTIVNLKYNQESFTLKTYNDIFWIQNRKPFEKLCGIYIDNKGIVFIESSPPSSGTMPTDIHAYYWSWFDKEEASKVIRSFLEANPRHFSVLYFPENLSIADHWDKLKYIFTNAGLETEFVLLAGSRALPWEWLDDE